eukprot:UN01485
MIWMMILIFLNLLVKLHVIFGLKRHQHQVQMLNKKRIDYDAERKLKQQKMEELARKKKEQEELSLRNDKGELLTKAEAQRLKELKAKSKEEITPQVMAKKLREIVGARGKRSTDIPAMLTELRYLETKAQDDQAVILRIRTLITLFSFDLYCRPQSGGSMSLSHWRETAQTVVDIMTTLENNVNAVRLVEDDGLDDTAFDSIEFDDEVEAALNEGADAAQSSEDVAAQKAWYAARKAALQAAKEKAKAEKEANAKTAAQAANKNIQFVEGNLYSFLYKLASEYYLGLQNCDHVANSTEYVNRLREQVRLLALLKQAYKYYIAINKLRQSQRIGEIILEYIYYSYDETKDILATKYNPQIVADVNSNDVDFWTEVVLKSDEPRTRIKALLYTII